MAWIVMRVISDGSGEDGSVPDEVFGPFKRQTTAEAMAVKLFRKQNRVREDPEHSEYEESYGICRCGRCLEVLRTDGDLPDGTVNFITFKLRTPKAYMALYHDGEEV